MKKKTLNSSSTNINNNIYENENEQENPFNEEPLYKHLYLLLLQIKLATFLLIKPWS
jgi:hypothetical protein